MPSSSPGSIRRGGPFLFTCVLFLAPLLIGASPVAELPSLEGLDDALLVRITAIEESGPQAQAQKRELLNLTRARKSLATYVGENDRADRRALSRVTRRVVKSATDDVDVILQLDAVFTTLDALAGLERMILDARLDQLAQLVKPRPLDLAEKSLAKGDALRADAAEAWATSPPKGVKLLLRARKVFATRVARSHKALVKGATNDLSVLMLEVITPSLQASHPALVSVVADVLLDTSEVTVSLRLMRRADVDAGIDEPLQYDLGELTSTNVPAGQYDWLFDVTLPSEVPADEYYLVAEIDPHGRIYEADEDDNLFFDQDAARPVGADFVGVPNLVLESFSFDPPEIVVDSESLDEAVVGVNVRLSLQGSSPLTDVPIGVFLDWDGGIMCVPPPAVGCWFVEPGSALVPVWSSVDGEYSALYLVPELTPGEALDVHLDFRLTEDETWTELFGKELAEKLSEMDADDPPYEVPGAHVRAYLDPFDTIPEYEPLGDDNQATADGTLRAYKFPDCDLEKTYAKTWSGDNVGVGIDFGAGIDIGKTGAEAIMAGSIPVWLFSSTPVDLFGFECLATRDPIADYGEFMLDVRFAGLTIYSKAYDSNMPTLPDGISLSADGFSYASEGSGGTAKWFVSKEWPEDEGKRTKTFYPGGYPVTVEMKVEGQVGFEVAVEASDTMSFGAGPFAALGVGLEAKTCISKLCVGAGGELTLIDDTLLATAFCEMDVVTQPEPEATSIDAVMGFELVNTITSLQGGLYAFAEYPWCKTCWAAFVPYPCKCGTQRATYQLVSWDPFFTVAQALFSSTCEVCVPVTGPPICP